MINRSGLSLACISADVCYSAFLESTILTLHVGLNSVSVSTNKRPQRDTQQLEFETASGLNSCV